MDMLVKALCSADPASAERRASLFVISDNRKVDCLLDSFNADTHKRIICLCAVLLR